MARDQIRKVQEGADLLAAAGAGMAVRVFWVTESEIWSAVSSDGRGPVFGALRVSKYPYPRHVAFDGVYRCRGLDVVCDQATNRAYPSSTFVSLYRGRSPSFRHSGVYMSVEGCHLPLQSEPLVDHDHHHQNGRSASLTDGLLLFLHHESTA